MTEDFDETSFPPHARLIAVEFLESEHCLRIELENSILEKVTAADVLSLHGARIRREALNFGAPKKGGSVLGKVALLAMGVPVNPFSGKPKETTTKSEEMQYVLGIRVKERDELWFLMATSFNFRKALGADAAYSLEMNVRAFIQKLGAFCPESMRDPFFEAALAKIALPQPVDGLMEFLKATRRFHT
jgi:hypothetical protein